MVTLLCRGADRQKASNEVLRPQGLARYRDTVTGTVTGNTQRYKRIRGSDQFVSTFTFALSMDGVTKT